jgi:hypothetical protein
LPVLFDAESRLDIDTLRWEQGFHLAAFFLQDHQPQTAVVLDLAGPGNELETHPAFLQEGLGVHGLMRGMEQKHEVALIQR